MERLFKVQPPIDKMINIYKCGFRSLWKKCSNLYTSFKAATPKLVLVNQIWGVEGMSNKLGAGDTW